MRKNKDFKINSKPHKVNQDSIWKSNRCTRRAEQCKVILFLLFLWQPSSAKSESSYRTEGKQCVCPMAADKSPAEVCGKNNKDGRNTVTVRLDGIVKELGAVGGQSSDGICTSVQLAPGVVVECGVVTSSARVVDSNFDVFCNFGKKKEKQWMSQWNKRKVNK